jgi:hypothetical protein
MSNRRKLPGDETARRTRWFGPIHFSGEVARLFDLPGDQRIVTLLDRHYEGHGGRYGSTVISLYQVLVGDDQEVAAATVEIVTDPAQSTAVGLEDETVDRRRQQLDESGTPYWPHPPEATR